MKGSIRGKLLFSFGIILMFSILIVLVSNNENQKSVEVYRKFTAEYKALSEFYRNIELAESHAEVYVYDQSLEQFDKYEMAIKGALDNLEQLYAATNKDEIKGQYRKLKNMVITYDETFQGIIKGDLLIADSYGFFSRLPINIQETYITHAEMITEAMKESYEQIDKRMERQFVLTGVVLVLMIIAAVAGMFLLAGMITRPIQKLVANIGRIKKGQYELEVVESSDAQITLLGQAIDEMAAGIQENLVHVAEHARLERVLLIQENENLKMNKTLVETELKVLQGQMNPHFLFNTLNLISKMAYLEGAPKTNELMEKTSDLLRYSLDKSTGSSNLFDEIESIRNYVEIQKMRIGHRIDFQMKIESGIPNTIMQGMIIQPIIENAVIHGVSDMMEGAIISLSVFRENDDIIISVEDNGKGISSDNIEKIFAEVEEAESGKSSIGVRNVRKRVEMFHGEEGAFNIESNENCGTVVTIRIPIVEEEGYVQINDCGGRTN